MRLALLDLLACPLCRGPLRLSDPAQPSEEDIVAGALVCGDCRASFPISGGIPRLLPSCAVTNDEKSPSQESGARRTASTFGYEFTHFSQPPSEANRLLFFRKTGIDPAIYRALKNNSKGDSLSPVPSGYEPSGEFLEGKLALELGCGMGRFAAIARDYAREVVALDLSGAVDVARRQYGHLPNLHFVQGDILDPPLRHASFDFVYSLGVLHHTRSTSTAFREASSLCKPGGHVAVWVYPPSYWNGVIRGSVAKTLRLVTARLSPSLLHVFCWLLYPLGKLQMWLARSRWRKILGAAFFLVPVPRDQERGEVDVGVIYDYYSPHYIWTHPAEEVYDWYVDNGFDEIRILPVPTAVIGRRRGKAPATKIA